MTSDHARDTAAGRADETPAIWPRHRLLYLIKRSYSAAKVALDEMTRAHGMTSSDYTMLSFLRRLEPCSAADLARAQRVTPQAVTQQVAQLKAKGLVTSRESEANRRISLISMTPRGRAGLAEVSAAARRAEEQLMDGLSGEERDLVVRFLIRSVAILERKEPVGNDE
ncbi:MarR family winged helix-turn-helix transcriptional regulator [Sphingomonas canadensis]|uniref:MarR family winged helix-turn-helix transcriptional regulator n=1 Tax=Sphingomonas canadensis TaxID=1219257 RepID=A0ABW3H8Q9_9SPHN|nr:MarR family transcriptional regulator [Sphingomonas canadensis]MCW3837595.1 MarR family transcriptional regulator [Sphingomonas canadensis]